MVNILLISDRDGHFLPRFGKKRQELGLPLGENSGVPSLTRVETLKEADGLVTERQFTHIVFDVGFLNVLPTVQLVRENLMRPKVFVIFPIINEEYEGKLKRVGAECAHVSDSNELDRLVDRIVGERSTRGKELNPR